MRPLPMSFHWLTRSTASQAQLFPWKISKSANALFRFPTTSGWRPPETTLRFLTYTGKSSSSLLTSTRFNVITAALSTTLPALSRETNKPCLCFSIFASLFLFGMTIPEPNKFRQLDTFPHLRNCTPKLPHSSHPALPLAFHRVAHPWLFLRRQLLHTLFVSLIVLFLPSSVSVVLCSLEYCVFFCFFFAWQFSQNYPRQFFRGEAFLYSGFNFWHYDLPFPTRYCISFVRSGLYQLVIHVKGFQVSAHDLDSHCIIRFCPSAWTPRFQRESSCVSLAHGPCWLFLLSRHRKAFLLLLIRSLL